VIHLLDDTPAYKAGIKAGDKIIKINNESTKDMGLQDAISKMRGAPSTTVKLTILREGLKANKGFTIMRETIKIDSVKSEMFKDGIGYIKIYQFQKQTASDFSAALSNLMQKNMKSLILDLRDNPGGLLYSAVDVASQFIQSDKLVVYTKNKKGLKKKYRSRKKTHNLAVPIVVIVNGKSASASEIVAGALKDWHRATIIGTTTYGKGSVQTVMPLKDGSAVRLTTARYYTPEGNSIQATGISPDILVKHKIKKGQPVHIVKRERDLEGHLTNGELEQTNISKEIVPVVINEKEDKQLQMAIDILRNKKTFQIANLNKLKNVSSETSTGKI
jgi:carboxyl-terminal processing protease